jgi:hypothetical protein
MKASMFQKCSVALALAVAPFFGGCDAGQSASAASVNEPAAQSANTQSASDPATADAEANAQDTNAISAADVSAGTNADTVLEKANGQLISSPDTAGTNVSNNPQLSDFVKLVQAGVGESVLLAYVTNSPSAFNVSSDDILYLNDLGTPESVVSAMLAKDQQINGTSATAQATSTLDTTAPPMNANMYAGSGNVPSTADLNAAAPVQTPPMVPSDAVEEEVQQSPNASYSYFYDSLAPYGNWVNLDGYGPCWQPTVVVANAGWSPYCDRGHWDYTDCGWCWVSDYSWGWAPFHYGRWFHNAHYGWCWAPDTVWGPAWVSWRYSDAYCGWAPLPPSACYRPGFGFSYYGHSVGFGFGFGIGASHFTFVGMDHFHDRNPGRFRVEHREVTKIYNTTVINNTIIRGNNHNLINRGVPVDRVAAASHHDIRPIRIRAEADGPRSPQLGRDGRSLAVYRPNLPAPRPGQAPRLVGEGVRPAPNFNLHNRVEQNHARAVAPRTPTGPYAPAVTSDRRPIIGNQNVNRPENAVRDNRENRVNQPNAERNGSLIMRGANQPDRQTPVRDQNAREFQPTSPNQPERGGNPRVVTPPMTPGGQSYRNQDVRQNPAREFNPPSATRPNVEQPQRQQRQLLQEQQQQQQQRNFQQQQRQQFQQPVTPRQEAPNRSFEVPRTQQPSYQPPMRSEGTPRMNDARPAPEMRSAPQYSAPARSEGGGGGRGDGGGNRGGGGDGGGRGGNGNNGNNNNGGGGGRGR